MVAEVLWQSNDYTVVRVGDVYVVSSVTRHYDGAAANTTWVLNSDREFVEFVPGHDELLPLLAQFEITVTRKEG